MIDRAIVYLPDPQSHLWATRKIAGSALIFRLLKTAERAGLRTIGLPGILRRESEKWGAPSIEARVLWLDHLSSEERSAFAAAPVLLLPANVLLSQEHIESLAAPLLLSPPGLVSDLWERLAGGAPLGEELENRLRGGKSLPPSGEEFPVVVTDAGSLKAAREALYRSLGTESDSLIDRLINRRGSRLLTRCLIHLPVTPNQVTLLSLALGLAGIWALWGASVSSAILGLALYMLSVVADHSDGEIARLTFQESPFGHWLDFSIDSLIHAGMALAMGATARSSGGTIMVVAGAVAAFGIIMSAISVQLLTRSGGEAEPFGKTLKRVGNRDFFYLVFVAFILSLWQAPAFLPFLVGILAAGTQAYWLICLAQRLWSAR